MAQFTINTFIDSAIRDGESCQYRVMEYAKNCTAEFGRNKVYPALSELIDLVNGLEQFLERKNTFHAQLPQTIKEIDLEKREIVFESQFNEYPDLLRIEELVQWALPLLKQCINEGISIYDFVEDNVSVSGVGILPIYKDEGYCIIPEHRAFMIHYMYYQVSLYASGNEKFRTLKTSFVESKQKTILDISPVSLKQDFISRHGDLPNPATYVCETELDFPLHETILPVVKRKLLANITSSAVH
ncbi:MAG: hypothetical protein AB1728_04225 [Bacteroidota bacterium]